MKWVVVGAGAWGSAFAKLAHEREHAVTLACRSAELARAISTTGRNERYLPGAELDGIVAVTIAEAPFLAADVIVVAVPSPAFRQVVEALPGTAPVLSLTEAPRHPHNVQRGTFVEDEGMVMPAPAPRFSATPAPKPRLAGEAMA